MQRKSTKNVYNIVIVGLMAAMVFVATYLHLDVPLSATDKTMVHLGNSMCVLAGLLFGPMLGGLAAGLGSMIYDMFDPIFLPGAWWTFIAKFVMGFVAGLICKLIKNHGGVANIAGAVCGAFSYMVLYLGKNFVTNYFIQGLELETVFVTLGTKAITSAVNAAIAIVVSVILASFLRPALSKAKILGERQ